MYLLLNIRFVVSDVWKEETDVAFERGLEPKEVNGMISKAARQWFMGELDKIAYGADWEAVDADPNSKPEAPTGEVQNEQT